MINVTQYIVTVHEITFTRETNNTMPNATNKMYYSVIYFSKKFKNMPTHYSTYENE